MTLYISPDCKLCGEPMSKVTDHSVQSDKNYGEDFWECMNGHKQEIIENMSLVNVSDEDPIEAFWKSEQEAHRLLFA